ncbi:uncharacterized protein LOC135928583 [Gordionus sp. m RMFG-2023]|uniref:uncharacterized protein LOC135928583 n=1 Tax=Gordionus sp. m RMFG-2023 TaxID=3053472 RepID=UPI0031FCFA21
MDPNIDWHYISSDAKEDHYPIRLLKNGNLCGSVSYEGKKYMTTNTCAIDAFIQLLTSANIDSPAYKNYMALTSPSLTNIGESLTRKHILNAYKQRINILNKLFKANILPNNVYHIAAESNIYVLINKIIAIGMFEHTTEESVVCSKESFIYTLRGVIAYEGNEQNDPNILGHYIAYCLRRNNVWEIL